MTRRRALAAVALVALAGALAVALRAPPVAPSPPAAPARDEPRPDSGLCYACAFAAYEESVGRCACGRFTTSRQFKTCAPCALAQNSCMHCRATLHDPASGLCRRCYGRPYPRNIGHCRCGAVTGSGAFGRCPPCARRDDACAACSRPLGS